MMKQTKRFIRTLSLFILIIICDATLVSLTNVANGEATIDEAQEVVQKFFKGVPLSLEYKGCYEWFYMDCYMFSSGRDRFYVEVKSGILRGFHFPMVLKESTEVLLTLNEVEEKAREFITMHEIQFTPDMELSYTEFLDHGTAGKEYLLIWHEIRNNVKLPTFAALSFSAETGQIIEFVSAHLTVTVSTEPKLTEHEATEIAISQAKFEVTKVSRQDLIVWFDKEGKQVLFWVIMVEGEPKKFAEDLYYYYTPSIDVYINAHTGEVVYTAER